VATTDRPGKITPGRGLITGILIVLGVFLLSASLGARSWILTALGVALIGAGLAVALVSRFNPGALTLTRRTTVALMPVGAQPVEAGGAVGASEVPRGAAPAEPPPGPLAVRPAPGTVPFIELDLTPARPARPAADPRGEPLTARGPNRLTGTNSLPGKGAHDNQTAGDQDSGADLDKLDEAGLTGDEADASATHGSEAADGTGADTDSGTPAAGDRADAGTSSGSANQPAETGPASGSANPPAKTGAASGGDPADAGPASGRDTAGADSASGSGAAGEHGASATSDSKDSGTGAAGGSAAAAGAAAGAAAHSGAPGDGSPEAGPPAGSGTGTGASGAGTPPRRRPSPRPRPPADDSPRTTLATGLTPYPLALDPGDGSRQSGGPAPRPRPGESDRPGTGLNGADPATPEGTGAEVSESVATSVPKAPDAEAAGTRTGPASPTPATNGRPPTPRPASPRILRLIPARPAAAAMPEANTAGSEQISAAYQKVSPPPGGDTVDTESTAELTVHNLGAAVEFYRDQLGLVQVHIGDKQAILQSGDAYVRLNVDRGRQPGRGPLIHVMLEVEDVRAAYEALSERGVSFVHEPRRVSRYHDLELWSAAFRDPDGHGLAVIRWDLPPEQS
jgi:catechol 2,3-dioxygenase-like lactoylglutathione lyase family enzyme